MTKTYIHKKKSNFTQISNDLLRDPRLSFAAKGLLCSLLSHDKDVWVISKSQIKKTYGITEHTCKKLFKELHDLGYAKLNFSKDETGLIYGSRWEVFEDPKENPDYKETSLESPSESQETPITDSSVKRSQKTEREAPKQKRAPKGQGKLEKKGIVRLEDGGMALVLKPKEQKVDDIDVDLWRKLNALINSSNTPKGGESNV